MFLVVFYLGMAIGWGAFGYEIYKTTYYENKAYAECVGFKNHKFESKHYFYITNDDSYLLRTIYVTYKSCIDDKCISKKFTRTIAPHDKFESNKESLFLKVSPSLTYANIQVSTNVEGYKNIQTTRTCGIRK